MQTLIPIRAYSYIVSVIESTSYFWSFLSPTSLAVLPLPQTPGHFHGFAISLYRRIIYKLQSKVTTNKQFKHVSSFIFGFICAFILSAGAFYQIILTLSFTPLLSLSFPLQCIEIHTHYPIVFLCFLAVLSCCDLLPLFGFFYLCWHSDRFLKRVCNQ